MDKLIMSNQVPMLVMVDDTFVGVAKDTGSLVSLLESYVDEDELNTEYMTKNVKLYPVLSAEPMDVEYEVERAYLVDSSTRRSSTESWYIEDIDEEFDSESDLHYFITSALEEGDYDENDVKDWDITYREKTVVDIEIGYESVELKVWGAHKTVGEYVKGEVEELLADEDFDFEDIDEEDAKEEADLTEVIPPKHIVYASRDDLSYVTHHGARQRVREGMYVYVMTGDTGLPTKLLADVEDAIAEGKSFARLIQD